MQKIRYLLNPKTVWHLQKKSFKRYGQRLRFIQMRFREIRSEMSREFTFKTFCTPNLYLFTNHFTQNAKTWHNFPISFHDKRHWHKYRIATNQQIRSNTLRPMTMTWKCSSQMSNNTLQFEPFRSSNPYGTLKRVVELHARRSPIQPNRWSALFST